MTTNDLRLSVPDAPVDEVSAVVHEPDGESSIAFPLTHGAGGTLDTPGLVALCEALADLGHTAIRANLPYREAGRKAPPKAERAAGWMRPMLEAAADEVRATTWIVGGKSYGGRVASLAVADGMHVEGLLFYGYPLHPPGKQDKLRVAHWPDIDVPCLFLQGTRDPFCELPLLREHLTKIPRRSTLEVVEGGDHSLKISRAASSDDKARNEKLVLRDLASVVDAWVSEL